MGDNREYSKNRNMGRRGPGGHGGMMPGEKAKDFKGTTRKILSYIGSYKIAIVLVMISAVAGTVFNIVRTEGAVKGDNRDIQRSCIKGVRRSGH